MQVYGTRPTFQQFAKSYVREKELAGSHVEHELLVLAMAVDSQVRADDKFINTASCEILCRR
eukprot:11156259-Lingulodinium_polyedra.AAC.1